MRSTHSLLTQPPSAPLEEEDGDGDGATTPTIPPRLEKEETRKKQKRRAASPPPPPSPKEDEPVLLPPPPNKSSHKRCKTTSAPSAATHPPPLAGSSSGGSSSSRRERAKSVNTVAARMKQVVERMIAAQKHGEVRAQLTIFLYKSQQSEITNAFFLELQKENPALFHQRDAFLALIAARYDEFVTALN